MIARRDLTSAGRRDRTADADRKPRDLAAGRTACTAASACRSARLTSCGARRWTRRAGRIHLMTQVLDGAELSDSAAAEHLDRCLGCMACVPACPSGVQYDRLIEAARTWVEDPAHAPAARHGDRARRTAPACTTWRGQDGPEAASPSGPDAARAEARFRRSLRGRAGAGRDLRGVPLPAAAPAAHRAAARCAADRPGPADPAQQPARPGLPRTRGGAAAGAAGSPGASAAAPAGAARGPRRAVVGMLTGCVQGVFFPQVNTATARVLAAEGCDVVIPRTAGVLWRAITALGRAGGGG